MNSLCTQIDVSCQNFDINQGVCLACYIGYQLNSTNNCVKSAIQTNSNPYCAQWQGTVCLKCAVGSIFNSKSICIVLDPSCKTNNMVTGACLSCYSGYVLASNGTCDLNQNQSVSDPNCNQFNTNGVCTKCSNGYYFNNLNVCIKIDDNCKSFNIASAICVGCYPGYDLNNLNQCIESVSNITDPNCAQFNGNTCIKCSFGAIFDGNGVCQIVNPNCKSFNNVTGTCLECYSGYQLNSTKACIKSAVQPNSNVYCANFSGSICLKCAVGSYFNSQGQCILFDSSCQTSSIINGYCLTCYPGYQLNSLGNCILAPLQNSTNPQCALWNGTQCLSCAQGTYFNNAGICQIVNPLCKTYNNVNGACTSCYSGYQVNGNGCVPANATQIDPFCKVLNGSLCIQCADRYYMNNQGTCTLISVFCLNYNNVTGACLTCFGGYQLSGTQCIQANSTTDPNCAQWQNNICSQCSLGSYFDVNHVCQIVNPLCSSFNTSNGQCLSCYQSYNLISGTCINDINNTVSDPNCATFQNNVCIMCSKFYYFNSNGRCTGVNPLCQTYNTTNGNCLSCYSGFQLSGIVCVNATVAPIDPNCKSFLNNTCITCSQGFFFNSNGVCSQANPNCLTWNSTNGNCLTCYNGYIINGTTCIVNTNPVNGDKNCAQWV